MTDGQGIQQTVSGSVHGLSGDIEGDLNIYRSARSLSDALREIQALLDHLQSNGIILETARQQVANEISTEAQENPTSMAQLKEWGQALEEAGSSAALDNEGAKEVLKVALRQAGIPSSAQS